MNKRVIMKQLSAALSNVNAEISGIASSGGKYGRAMSGEGYSGGYRDALNDVILLLNGVTPDRRNYWWFTERTK